MSAVLQAVLVLAGIGIIASVGLVVAAKFMFVPTNPRVDEVLEVLPGANCGACGFAGCSDYAAAVANGKAAANCCVPGADAVAAKVAAIMGVEAEDVVEKCAVVACRGCTTAAPKYDYVGVHTCEALAMFHSGPEACAFGCLGQGDCKAACPFNAICIVNGVAHIDPAACKGCGKCVAVCPKKLIRLVPTVQDSAVLCVNTEKGAQTRKICTNGCIGCLKCEKVCPSDAVHVTNNCAFIDTDKCTQCRACESECPVGCIDIGFTAKPMLHERTAPAAK